MIPFDPPVFIISGDGSTATYTDSTGHSFSIPYTYVASPNRRLLGDSVADCNVTAAITALVGAITAYIGMRTSFGIMAGAAIALAGVVEAFICAILARAIADAPPARQAIIKKCEASSGNFIAAVFCSVAAALQ